MKQTYQIRAAYNTTNGLTGQGEEIIVDAVTGEITARFWNGCFMTQSSLSQRSDATDGDTVILDTDAA